MSFFITLVETTDASRRELEALPLVHSLIHRGLPLAEYQAFLRDLYHIVLQFCPVMERAARRCDDFPAVRKELHERIVEERGHEAWVLQDVESLGGDADEVRAGLPSAPVQAMIGFNHAAAEWGHPCSALGMLYALEVVSSVYGGRVSDSIARNIGRKVDDGGFRFLSSHASMDADHMAKLNVVVKTIADRGAQAAIVNSTRVNFYQFGRMFEAGGFTAHLMQPP
jgi:pyrroloquinoline quinone (PQQ) biosynthesis protein C